MGLSPEVVLAIEYATHAANIAIGYAILRFSRTPGPAIRLLPSAKGLRWLLLVAISIVAYQVAAAEGFLGARSIGLITAADPLWYIAAFIPMQGIFVGWSEEYLFRGSVQRVLNSRLPWGKGWWLRPGTLVAALLFSFSHVWNALLGLTTGPVTSVISTGYIFPFLFGLVMGVYYDRTNDLAAIAWLHNLNDLLGSIL